jgi:hypothetical protein
MPAPRNPRFNNDELEGGRLSRRPFDLCGRSAYPYAERPIFFEQGFGHNAELVAVSVMVRTMIDEVVKASGEVPGRFLVG